MDPTDPGGQPPTPEQPAPPRPAWPAPPAASWPGQPPGSAPPGQQGWAPPPPPPRPARRRVGLLLVAVAGLLVAALVAAVLAVRPGVQAGAPRAVGQQPATRPAADPRAELPRLLNKRATAVLEDNRAAFLATVDKRQKKFYRQQANLFARMRTVPFSTLAYTITDTGERSSIRLRRRYHADQVIQAQVQARYRFKGQDASPVLARDSYTFALTRSVWRIAGPGDAGQRRRDDTEIWDGGPVRTAGSPRTLIVHHPGDEALARRLLRVADRAYAQVDAAWTGRWERKAVILVPKNEEEAEELVGASDLSRVAAVASSSVESGATERVLGNRIVVNTDNMERYNDLNLQVLITHEMTHVATRALGDGVPLLLVEGFADWAALKPLGYPFAVTRPNLARRVRAGGFDGRLPDDGEFRGPDAAVAYDEGSAFCLWVADTYGATRLQALYRQFKGSDPPSPAEFDRGFRRVLHLTRRQAERRWAAWVRSQL
jgi:hypothetical protein